MVSAGLLTLADAQRIAANVLIGDDGLRLHPDHEKWLEGLAPHAPISQYPHDRNSEDACPP